mgnify:CR=1 FL=1|jgi:hypothetical protein
MDKVIEQLREEAQAALAEGRYSELATLAKEIEGLEEEAAVIPPTGERSPLW